MKNFEDMKHFPMLETMYTAIAEITQNSDIDFAKLMAAYEIAKLASTMNTMIDAGPAYGKHTVNFFGMSLAPSGYGKDLSKKIIRKQIVHLFKNKFDTITEPYIRERNLEALADTRARQQPNRNYEDELTKVLSEFKLKTNNVVVHEFRNGTPEGVAQYREGLLMSKVGSINFEVNEIGSNLQSAQDLIELFLELYDGEISSKMIKNTNDNKRTNVINGEAHCNCYFFGEPVALLDNGTNEALLDRFLETGYVRRLWYAFSDKPLTTPNITPEELLRRRKDTTISASLIRLSKQFEALADPVNYNNTIGISDEAELLLAEYELYCKKTSEKCRITDTLRRTECAGRFFKAFRLSGAFAWCDSSNTIEQHHLEAAIKLAEESGKAFEKILTRPPVYARLATYLANADREMTHAELMSELRYYPKAAQAQKELLKNCIAWGYKNNIVITRSTWDGIEFMRGEKLQETSLDKLILSWSTDFTENYAPEDSAVFEHIERVTQNPNLHWCAHRFTNNYRASSNAILGFNLIVLDIDTGCTINEARAVLEDYVYHIYTSKSHKRVTEKNPNGDERFRIVIPMSHHLKLSPTEYKEFMKNVHEFLPFPTDTQTGDIARKWESCSSAEVYNNMEGKLFDILPFIPKTKKNDDRIEMLKPIKDTSGIQRWFLSKMLTDGCCNNHLQRFGYMLLDGGYGLQAAHEEVQKLNNMLDDPIEATTLFRTVMSSMTRHAQNKGYAM